MSDVLNETDKSVQKIKIVLKNADKTTSSTHADTTTSSTYTDKTIVSELKNGKTTDHSDNFKFMFNSFYGVNKYTLKELNDQINDMISSIHNSLHPDDQEHMRKEILCYILENNCVNI